MATFRGFVRSIQVRDDGWVECVLEAVHAGNTRHTFFIEDIDGAIEYAHRRLAKISLLRDALVRVLPVELEYRQDPEQGDLIDDLTIYVRPSIEEGIDTRRIEGVVIGIAVVERGPKPASPGYLDQADLAGVALLLTDGSIEQVMLDLQRPDTGSGAAMLSIVREAHRTRRPLGIYLAYRSQSNASSGGDSTGRDWSYTHSKGMTNAPQKSEPEYIRGVEWITVNEKNLDYVYAYIERLGQRYESYEADAAPALSHVRVLYTTAPGQTPAGDISDNGSFTPATLDAWVHSDSPLLARLEAALRDKLQVKLGLDEANIHEVEIIGHLGSAARPIWIEVKRSALPIEGGLPCDNTPTIQYPTQAALNEIPVSVAWTGEAYFNEGIWRFVVRSGSPYRLSIDGKPCCEPAALPAASRGAYLDVSYIEETTPNSAGCHAYLCGMHTVEIVLTGRNCQQPFKLQVYRIR